MGAKWLSCKGLIKQIYRQEIQLMIKGQITIINKLGLHARAAAKLVNTTARFSSSILIGSPTNMVDAKSIMSVMMLAASQGSILDLEVVGEDKEQAMDAVCALVNDRFGENE